MRCPVIRWQGERMKRQGLLAILAGGLCGCCGRMLRRQLSRQQKAAVTPPGRGYAPWPGLWWELLLGVCLDALRAGKTTSPLLSLKGGKLFLIGTATDQKPDAFRREGTAPLHPLVGR